VQVLFLNDVTEADTPESKMLLQMQGSGLSSSFGGTGEFYRSKRSVEKLLMWATVVTTVIFAVVSLLLLLPLK